jgi:hypothetical protein
MEETPQERKKRLGREKRARDRERHPDAAKLAGRKYYEAHREEILAKNKKFFEEHKEEQRAIWRNYERKHRDARRAKARKEKEESPETFQEKWQRWYANHKDRVKEKSKLPNGRLRIYKYGANARNIPWLLSDEDALGLFIGECFYCGLEPMPTNGIDRKNSAGAYEITNVVTSCSDCNIMKHEMGIEKFIERCGLIWKKHGPQ